MSPSNFYNLQIPNDWTYEEEEDNLLTIYKRDNGVGALQISSYSISEDYVMDIEKELLELSAKYFKNFSIDGLKDFIKKDSNSASIETENSDSFRFFKIIFEKNKLLFITYNCDNSKKNIERLTIKHILNSVKIN
jgi:hypothetical protein